MTTSPLLDRPGVLLGDQRPRVELVPPFVSSAGREAVELAASAGLVLDPAQRYVLEGSLGERLDGTWSASEVGVIEPRQNGKGVILTARELAGLALFGEKLIIHSAHLFDTSLEAFMRLLHLMQSTSDLDRLIVRVSRSHGEEGIELRSGQRIRFKTRTAGSGRGFTADTIILDEAYNLSAANMAALMPTLSAIKNPQIWYTSSGGMDTSEVLRRVRERGTRGGPGRLAYYEWSADPKCDLDDRTAWAQANPALGIRISEESIASEREAMPEEEFARERLGIWSDSTAALVIALEQWAALADKGSSPVGMVGLSVDTSPDRSVSSLAIAGRRGDGRLHVEVPENRAGTAWVVPRVVGICGRQDVGGVAIDPRSQASGFIEPLRDAGVTVWEMSTKEAQQACGAFFDAATTDQLRHLGDPLLAASLAGATKRDVSDAWLWNRRTARSDITPLVAATNAAWAHDRAAAEKPTEVWGFFT